MTEELLRRQTDDQLKAYATELEASNRDLQEAKAEAERQSGFKSRFLANMSHELRTPLNAIIGFSELLEQEEVGPLSAEQRDFVVQVLESGRHLLDLVNDILDLSKIDAGKMELDREWVDFGALVGGVQKSIAPLAAKKEISIAVSIPSSLPLVFLDQVRIRQVLLNLLSNAIKFTPVQGKVSLTAERRDDALRVTCKDNGVGIRAEDLPRLFSEFEQMAPKGGREGTGLGLALTQRLIRLHGGEIRVQSEPGQGSSFEFDLADSIARSAPRQAGGAEGHQ